MNYHVDIWLLLRERSTSFINVYALHGLISVVSTLVLCLSRLALGNNHHEGVNILSSLSIDSIAMFDITSAFPSGRFMYLPH